MSLMARASKGPGMDERPAALPGGDAVNALLGRGTSFEGKLTFEGTVHLNGHFVGEIHSPDTLVVGEGARVQGEISVGTLIVNGEVSGTVRARQLVEMHAPARVRGTVETPVLTIDRGVVFEGQTKMENLDASRGARAAVAPEAGGSNPPPVKPSGPAR